MRWARSYSIIDHQLLHGGYFSKLSHEAMALYLFLVVVGNPDGKSFYGERTIRSLLRLSAQELDLSRKQLMELGLVRFHKPYWWVKNLSPIPRRSSIQPGNTHPQSAEQPVSISQILGRLQDAPEKGSSHA